MLEDSVSPKKYEGSWADPIPRAGKARHDPQDWGVGALRMASPHMLGSSSDPPPLTFPPHAWLVPCVGLLALRGIRPWPVRRTGASHTHSHTCLHTFTCVYTLAHTCMCPLLPRK